MSKKRRNDDDLYELMRDAIGYMRTHRSGNINAAQVASAVGMSESRFNHAFAEWIGLSPKRFLSYMTKERAKELLKDTGVLEASYKAGLSGPGRLHELLVVHDAVSPGEFKSGEIEIRYGIAPSPFGWCVIGLTKRGICSFMFLDSSNEKGAVKRIRHDWPKATLIRDDARIEPYVKKIFIRSGKKQHLPLVLKGTNFQTKVWEALLSIPEGRAASYAEIARLIGKPKAVRAVGSACGQNPIWYLIPCHRVLTSNGGLGGYAGGIERKDTILAWEAARTSIS